MRYIVLFILISMVTVIGCTPAQDPAPETTVDTAQAEPSFEEAMATYKTGEWIESWDDAIAAAKELKRPILVNFTGSDWCSWCMKLSNEVFTKDSFKKYAEDNLVLLKLDFPRRLVQSNELKAQNSNLQRQFGIQGYPTIVLVDANGKEINRTGYQPGGPEAYISHLKDLMAKK